MGGHRLARREDSHSLRTGSRAVFTQIVFAPLQAMQKAEHGNNQLLDFDCARREHDAPQMSSNARSHRPSWACPSAAAPRHRPQALWPTMRRGFGPR